MQNNLWDTDSLALQIARRTPEAIIIADAKGIIRYWNAGASRLFGYSTFEVIGQPLDIIIPEKHRPAHWAGWAKVVQTGKSRYEADALLAVPGLTKDGNRISLEFSIFAIPDSDGKIVGIGATLRDVSGHHNTLKKLSARLKNLSED